MGVIMGTAAYMSPDQASGQTADKQSYGVRVATGEGQKKEAPAAERDAVPLGEFRPTTIFVDRPPRW